MVVAQVIIELKKGITDPEGMNTKKALNLLGWDVKDVKSGKIFEIDMGDDVSEEQAVEQVEAMCKRLLANPVIQTYEIRMIEG